MLFVWHTMLAAMPAVRFYFLSVLCFAVVECIFPAERRQPARDYFANLQYDLLYYFVTPFAVIVPTALVAAVTSRLGSGWLRIDLDHIRLGVAAIDWPLRNILLPLVPLVAFDFFYYWHHRLQHTVPTFWTIHRLHHSTESLNSLAAFRIHWLEEPMRIFTMTLPMTLLLNINVVQGAWIAAGLAQLATLIHANIRIPYGPLTGVVAGPQTHRIHHSFEPQHINRNYAAIFPFWDMLFGTWCAPQRGEWPQTGLSGGERPRSVAWETVQPFVTLGTWGTRLVAGKRQTDRRVAVTR